MTLLYRGLRQLLSVAMELYYVDVQSTGRSNIPDGPVIFAANHPNSIMDTMILGTQTSRQICYMARSGLFDNPLVAWLFDQTGVIPIYRNPKEDGGSNEDSFRRAYDLLEEGGALGIFPEGRNSLERQVLDIKTGTARIALGAERRNNYNLGVRIVPVGLNFVDRDRFLSSVLVRFGEPIDARKYAAKHREAEREAVREFTDEVQKRLRDLATHIEGDRVVDLVKDIYAIYGRSLLNTLAEEREEEKRRAQWVFDDLREGDVDDESLVQDILDDDNRGIKDRLFDEVRHTPEPKEDLEERFWAKRRIAQAVEYFEEHHPDLARDMRIKIWRYKDHLRQVHLRHDFGDRPPETLSFRKEALRFTSYAIAFAIPAVWGFITNVLPYLITRFFALRAKNEAKRAFTGLMVGFVAFSVFYAGQGVGIWYLTSGSIVWTVVYLFSLPITGFFFLRYRRQLARYRSRILTRTLFRTERNLIEDLIGEREDLIEEFDELRQRFLEAEEKMELVGDVA